MHIIYIYIYIYVYTLYIYIYIYIARGRGPVELGLSLSRVDVFCGSPRTRASLLVFLSKPSRRWQAASHASPSLHGC